MKLDISAAVTITILDEISFALSKRQLWCIFPHSAMICCIPMKLARSQIVSLIYSNYLMIIHTCVLTSYYQDIDVITPIVTTWPPCYPTWDVERINISIATYYVLLVLWCYIVDILEFISGLFYYLFNHVEECLGKGFYCHNNME
jgi:hypothetical protein